MKYTYNKKVYDICVNHPKAFEKETRAVVIEGDDIKAINDEGLFKLNTSEHSPKNSSNIKAPYMGYDFTNAINSLTKLIAR